MSRACILLVLTTLVALSQGRPDPEFDKIPFDEWLKGGDNAPIRWSLHVAPPYLSEQQQFVTHIGGAFDAGELVRRHIPGQTVFLLEIRDDAKRTYRTQRALFLRNSPERTQAKARPGWSESVCLLPGDYEVAAAVYDRLSKEHSLKRAKLRIPEIHHDPLLGIWSDLPNVAFERACYRPLLSLPLETEKPVRIDVIASRPADPNTNIEPRLTVISEMKITNGSMTATALDLESRKVRTRSVVRRLDGNRFWSGFPNAGRYMVDVRALEDDRENAQFFVSEIRKRMESPIPEAQHALIILSEPRKFPKGEDLRPIQATPQPGTRVFYIRCHWPDAFGLSPGPPPPGPQDLPMHPELPSGPFPVPRRPSSRSDSLERTLAPLHPRLFDVTTALEFRSALAAIMSDISQQK